MRTVRGRGGARRDYVDVLLYDGANRPAIEVRKNKFVIDQPKWDRQMTPNELEVVSEKYEPVFQMITRRVGVIEINGIFGSPKGSILDAFPPWLKKAIFKYPSWRYPGVYAQP